MLNAMFDRRVARRRVAWAVLACCLLVGILPAWAEPQAPVTISATIDYPGAWVSFPAENFRLFIPSDWYVVQTEETESVILMNGTKQQVMWIDVVAGEGYTMDGLLAAFSQAEGFESVAAVYFNEVPFVRYLLPDDDMFGAITMAADGTRVFFFKFSPLGDEAFSVLATKIMASLSPIPQ